MSGTARARFIDRGTPGPPLISVTIDGVEYPHALPSARDLRDQLSEAIDKAECVGVGGKELWATVALTPDEWREAEKAGMANACGVVIVGTTARNPPQCRCPKGHTGPHQDGGLQWGSLDPRMPNALSPREEPNRMGLGERCLALLTEAAATADRAHKEAIEGGAVTADGWTLVAQIARLGASAVARRIGKSEPISIELPRYQCGAHDSNDVRCEGELGHPGHHNADQALERWERGRKR